MDTNTRQAELAITGMTCASCVGRVERALSRVPGVLDASVNLATERARVATRGEADLARLIAAVTDAGYAAAPVTGEPTAEAGSAPGASRCDQLFKTRRPTSARSPRSTWRDSSSTPTARSSKTESPGMRSTQSTARAKGGWMLPPEAVGEF